MTWNFTDSVRRNLHPVQAAEETLSHVVGVPCKIKRNPGATPGAAIEYMLEPVGELLGGSSFTFSFILPSGVDTEPLLDALALRLRSAAARKDKPYHFQPDSQPRGNAPYEPRHFVRFTCIDDEGNPLRFPLRDLSVHLEEIWKDMEKRGASTLTQQLTPVVEIAESPSTPRSR